MRNQIYVVTWFDGMKEQFAFTSLELVQQSLVLTYSNVTEGPQARVALHDAGLWFIWQDTTIVGQVQAFEQHQIRNEPTHM